MCPTFLLIFRQPGQNGGDWYPKCHAVGDDYIGSHRHGVPLSLLEDEDLSTILNHVLGISPGTDYIYSGVAFPIEQKMTSYVCFAKISSLYCVLGEVY